MPELPEVETVRRGLAGVMEGAVVRGVRLARPDLRFPFPERFAERLVGCRIGPLGRRAKYLLFPLDSGETVIAHLGMSGSFRIERDNDAAQPGEFHHARGRLAAHDHVILNVETADGGTAKVIYNDPRRFGFMLMAQSSALDSHPSLSGLGIEPLSNAMNGAALARLFSGKATSLKAALLDQRQVCGLGNIYACEAMHGAGLSPTRKAGALALRDGGPSAAAERLAGEIRAVLDRAILAGGSTLRDHAQADGTLGYFQHSFRVYGREGEPCPRTNCRGTVRRIVQNGRSTFYCPACQR